MKELFVALYLLASSVLQQVTAAETLAASRKLFLETKAKAEKGDSRAQSELGDMYEAGDGVPRDEAEAHVWYRKAADQGDAYSQFSVGRTFWKGAGVQSDAREALKWYRKAGEQGYIPSFARMGLVYLLGGGIPKDEVEAVRWFQKGAEKGDALAQFYLGIQYQRGQGVEKDLKASMKWFRAAAEQHLPGAQYDLGLAYYQGSGVEKDLAEAVKWFRKAAEQNDAEAQFMLGSSFALGNGVVKDDVEGYKWLLLAGGQNCESAKRSIVIVESRLTQNQRAEGQKLAREFKPQSRSISTRQTSGQNLKGLQAQPESTATGFFITDDGYFITNEHVAGEGATVRLLTAAGTIAAKVVKVDRANDLALLKAEGKFTALPVITSRGVRLGATAATVGFPNTGLQGFAPKLARGEIASLAGAQDDARHFQISAPIQPGNSGGALVDERGNVIGVVVAKLSQRAALATSGALAENVNYAVKSSYLLSFLESVPEVAAKLKEAHAKDRKFEDVVKSVEQATVLVLVY